MFAAALSNAKGVISLNDNRGATLSALEAREQDLITIYGM
jgi:hypothetical protein